MPREARSDASRIDLTREQRIDALVPTAPAFLAIFDHDGVLVDTLELHQQAWLDLGRQTGLGLTPEFIHETFGMTNPSIFRLLLGDAISEADMARYSALKEECYRGRASGRIALMDGVREVLDALSAAGARLAIGSSGVRENLELTVRECGLDGPVRGDRRARGHHPRQARPPGLPRRRGPVGRRAVAVRRLRGCTGGHPGREGRRHVRRRGDEFPPGRAAPGRRRGRGGRAASPATTSARSSRRLTGSLP